MAPKTGTISPFGKFTRTLRIYRDEYMKDMAEKLDVNPAFLSAVETGRRNPPHDWADRLRALYNLTDAEHTELVQAIYDSRSYENLNVAHLSFEDRRIMRGLSELLPTLDDERREVLTEWVANLPQK